MYKSTPWTVKNEKKNSRVKKSNYIKNRETDLAISVSRVKDFFKQNKEKGFSTSQVADSLGLSEGTVSNILNRLATIGDINVITMRRPHWSPIYQSAECAAVRVPFTYTREDCVISILNIFEADKNATLTKYDIMDKTKCTESMLSKSLQVLLANETIKLVGSTDKGKAIYQHKEGNKKAIPIKFEKDDNYSSISNYIKRNNLKVSREDILEVMDTNKKCLFYSAIGLTYVYPIDSIEKAIEKLSKKTNKKGIIEKLFS